MSYSSKKSRTRKSTKSEQKRESLQDSGEVEKTEVAKPAKADGVMYRLTFLANQLFRGQFYEKGEQIEVPEWITRSYKERTALKFEKI